MGGRLWVLVWIERLILGLGCLWHKAPVEACKDSGGVLLEGEDKIADSWIFVDFALLFKDDHLFFKGLFAFLKFIEVGDFVVEIFSKLYYFSKESSIFSLEL